MINRFIKTIGVSALALLTSKKSGLASTVQTLVRTILILLINFGTGIITARYLGPSGRGEQAAMIIWPQMFAFSFSLGLGGALLYRIKSNPEQAPQLVTAAGILGVLAGGIAALVGATLIPHWLSGYSHHIIVFAQWAMLASPLIGYVHMSMATFQAAGRFRLFNGMLLLSPVLTLFGLFILITTDHFTPRASALAYLMPTVPVFLFCLIASAWLYKPKRDFNRNHIMSLLSYGMRIWATDLLSTLSDQLERAILVGFLSPSTLGLYVVAQSMTIPLNAVNASTITVLFPTSIGRSVEQISNLVGLAIRVNLAITLFGALMLTILSAPLLSLFYGHEFDTAIGAVYILIFVPVLNAITMPALQLFFAIGRPGIVAILQGLALVFFIPMVLLLVPKFGIEGAATAWLLSAALRVIAVYCCFPLVLRIPPPWPILKKADLIEVAAKIRYISQAS